LRGRAFAERLMVDTCTITRQTGATTDPDTGVITPTFTTVYTGRCKVQQSAVPIGEPRDLGQASIQVLHLELHLPIAAAGILVDDVATITASTLDPDLVGRRFTVRGTSHKTFLTARRLDIQELDS
jgi:hypothetical protein